MKYSEKQFGQQIQNRGLVLNKLNDGGEVRRQIQIILETERIRGRKSADPMLELANYLRTR